MDGGADPKSPLRVASYSWGRLVTKRMELETLNEERRALWFEGPGVLEAAKCKDPPQRV